MGSTISLYYPQYAKTLRLYWPECVGQIRIILIGLDTYRMRQYHTYPIHRYLSADTTQLDMLRKYKFHNRLA